MAVKIRLRRTKQAKGRYNYRVVVADAKEARDGRFIEEVGYYCPSTIPATFHLDMERVAVAGMNVGNAQTAVDEAVSYAKERIQFGRPIGQFQVIKHMLADMQLEVDAARLLTYRAAAIIDSGLPSRKEVSMAKLYATETLFKVATQGMQIMGGYGTMPDFDMERYFREGKQATIGAGTSQIQRSIIARELGL